MSVHGAVKGTYLALGRLASNNRLLEYKWFAEQEADSWSHWVELPLRERIELWRHGFTSPFGKLYDFERYGYRPFLSVLQRYRLYRAMNGRHRYLVDDKLSQHWMMSDYPEHRPTAYGLVDRGYVHGVSGTELDGPPVPVSEWLPAVLRERSRVVLKQLRGMGGKQVRIASYDDGYRLDDEPTSEAELLAEVEELSGHLATEYVDQHDYADALYPHSVNTIRLMTLWDDREAELLIPFAVQRIGTERSRPVDNFSVGGLTAEIDRETGELGPAAQFPYEGDVPWYSTHPDTGSQIEGARVANWEAVRSTIERIATENTTIPAIGWDVIVDDTGEPVVIEANTGTEVDVFQVHRPMLSDRRVAELVSRYLPGVEVPVGEGRSAPEAEPVPAAT